MGGLLRTYVAERGAGDAVTFTGHVDERDKHDILARSWLMLLPSLKEGWGIVIGEAGATASHRRLRSAGGTRESIADGVSGLLVDTPTELTEAVRRLVGDDAERKRLGKGAREMSHTFSWAHSQESFAHVLSDVLAGRRVAVEDPDGPLTLGGSPAAACTPTARHAPNAPGEPGGVSKIVERLPLGRRRPARNLLGGLLVGAVVHDALVGLRRRTADRVDDTHRGEASQHEADDDRDDATDHSLHVIVSSSLDRRAP